MFWSLIYLDNCYFWRYNACSIYLRNGTKMKTDLEKIKESVLLECKEDHVDLRSIIAYVKEWFKDKDVVKQITLEVVHELLFYKEIKVGTFVESGNFQVSKYSPKEVIDKIIDNWEKKPNKSVNFWFTSL